MKYKKGVFFIIIFFLLFIVGYSAIVITALSGKYNLELAEEIIDNDKAKLLIPYRWVGFDAREENKKKIGYDSYLIYIVSNYGRFPRLKIYEVSDYIFDEEDEQHEKLIDWDISRMKSENDQYKLTIVKKGEFLSGTQMIFTIDTNQPILAPTVTCKDWITVEQNYGYIISICEREKRWEYLDTVYSNIIKSFEVFE